MLFVVTWLCPVELCPSFSVGFVVVHLSLFIGISGFWLCASGFPVSFLY